jgi:ATP-dependent DNA helicase RecG
VSQTLSTREPRTDAFSRLAVRLVDLVGDKAAKAFEPLKLRTAGDLMHHLPRRYLSGTELSDLSGLRPGEEVAVLAEVASTQVHPVYGAGRGRRGGRSARLEASITDGRGTLSLAFFGSPQLLNYWAAQLSSGSRGIFAGKVNEFNGRLQLAHPDFVMLDDYGKITGGAKHNADLATVGTAPLIGIYPSAGKLRTWTIAQCAGIVLDSLAGMDDPLPSTVREAAGVLGLEAAFRALHQPQTRAEIVAGRDRLRFEEAFALQLAMAHRRADAAAHGAVPRPRRSDGLLAAFDERLPFTLTAGQVEVSEQIMAEVSRPHPMQRLLQGEVGSGKTIVALRAMLAVVDGGGQAALLAPTEVLAAQHYQTVTTLLGDLVGAGLLAGSGPSTGVVLITGSMSAAQKRSALRQAASGDAGIVLGTHALLSEGVQFADLGLVVVDEQHRFGVEQRAALSAKASAAPHVLVMTATPIPRSVAMTVFGDLEVSTLKDVPAGRAEVSTVVVDTRRNPSWVGRAWQRVKEEVGAGRQAYVVCARISGEAKSRGGSEDLDEAADGVQQEPAAAAADVFAELSTGPLRDLRVDLLHGQLSSEEKDAAMTRFATGGTDVLVATTVVEVGVDVPNASMMVVLDADRFGISQLHQLRGRIGRGSHPGVCLLLSNAEPDTPARSRLDAVAATRDGFVLADVDLEQRREGDVLGASQSGGRSSLRLLRVLDDADLILRARQIAEACIAADPELRDPGLADFVDQIELQAAGEWLERT